MGDILVKANMAREFAKKNSSLKVEIRAREDNLEKAKNILYTVFFLFL
jgi:translation initiation factor IF-3